MFDVCTEMTVEQADKLSMDEKIKMAEGFEFILSRAIEIANLHETVHEGISRGKTFDEERYQISFRGSSIDLSWTWDEYGSYQYHEQHQEYLSIPLEAILSPTEEEIHLKAEKAKNERLIAERNARDEEARKRREEALARQQEQADRTNYERLKKKFES